jgi:hypothetical protein
MAEATPAGMVSHAGKVSFKPQALSQIYLS